MTGYRCSKLKVLPQNMTENVVDNAYKLPKSVENYNDED